MTAPDKAELSVRVPSTISVCVCVCVCVHATCKCLWEWMGRGVFSASERLWVTDNWRLCASRVFVCCCCLVFYFVRLHEVLFNPQTPFTPSASKITPKCCYSCRHWFIKCRCWFTSKVPSCAWSVPMVTATKHELCILLRVLFDLKSDYTGPQSLPSHNTWISC